MTFQEWFEESEGYTLRCERFFDDLDHHKEGVKGSYDRMKAWLEAAYNVALFHSNKITLDDGK